jgi:hypothetical protein
MDVHGKSKDTLESNWETPCDLTACIVECKSDPIGYHDSLIVSLYIEQYVGKVTKVIKDPENSKS